MWQYRAANKLQNKNSKWWIQLLLARQEKQAKHDQSLHICLKGEYKIIE